jgi:hypothetical protein
MSNSDSISVETQNNKIFFEGKIISFLKLYKLWNYVTCVEYITRHLIYYKTLNLGGVPCFLGLYAWKWLSH